MKQHSEVRLPLVDALMREHTGLSAGHLRDQERLSLLAAAMRKAGFSDDAAYALFLRSYPSSLLDLASQLSVGETYFFRDPAQLKQLTDEVLPRLMVVRPKDHVFKFWSAGCATGEEAYTLAMLLDERGLLERARIVGSDLSEAALVRARAGRYGSWSLRATPALAGQRYFRPLERDFQLASAIRAHVLFERQNLTDSAAPLPGDCDAFDVIVCRNVLIYFTAKACLEVSTRLACALSPGGTLFAGPSDPFVDLPLWKRETSRPGLRFRRLERADAWPRPASSLATDSERAARQPVSVRSAKPLSPRPLGAEERPRESAGAPPAAPLGARATPESTLDLVREIGKREGSERAVEACRRALESAPGAIDVYLWLSALLLELNRDGEAEATLRTLLYLDRKLVMGQLLSALLFRRRADHVRAARAYQRVVALCAEHDDDAPVPMGQGLDHRTLAEHAAAELRALRKLGRAS